MIIDIESFGHSQQKNGRKKTNYFLIQHMEPPNRYGDNKKSKKKRNLRYGHYFSIQHMGPP